MEDYWVNGEMVKIKKVITVTTEASIVIPVTTVASIANPVTTVANIANPVTTVANIANPVTTVASIAANIVTNTLIMRTNITQTIRSVQINTIKLVQPETEDGCKIQVVSQAVIQLIPHQV